MGQEMTFDDLLNQIESEGDPQEKLKIQVARLSADMATEMIKNLDMVGVVRCKNCVYSTTYLWRPDDRLLCLLNNSPVRVDDFCSNGRPENEE